MPAILIYLLKVNIALLLFCLCYYVILRRLTFYTLNRVYLITAILFSTLYPLVDFTSIMQRNQKLVQPIQVAVINLNLRAANFARPVAQTNYWEWLVALFWIGVVVMALRLVMQFISLLRIYRRSKPALINSYKVRVIADEANPFSFWQSIYINPHHHGADELQSIIAHEQVHVSQWHTLDILLAEISLVFYWFNPGVWLMKKAIAENLEFITDRKILQQGVDAKSYQYSLLYASFNTSPNAMVNHFNISTIKKRIMMMNSKKSSAYSLSRYGLIAPAILVLVLVFGTTKAELMKKGAHAVKQATEKAITAVNQSLSNSQINSKAASVIMKVKESAAKLSNNIANTNKADTTIKLSALSLMTDTPKRKSIINSSLAFPDSAWYLVNGTTPLRKETMNRLDPDDISSINIIDPATSSKIFRSPGNRSIVLIITKKEKDSPLVTDLLHQLQEINDAKIKETDAYNLDKANGSTNSITITSTGDSVNSKLKRATTYTGSSSYNAYNGMQKYSGAGHINVATVDHIKYNSSRALNTSIVGKRPIAASGSTHITTSTDILKGMGIKRDITAKDIVTGQVGGKFSSGGPNDPLYIIDGKPAAITVLNSINPDAIESINVIKNESATAIYGEKAKNGVVMITTKAGTRSEQIVAKGASGPIKPLYIIDGKPVAGNPMDTMNLSTIESIEVFKDAATTSLYGEKGKNGVVMITTKEGVKSKSKKPDHKN
jgi:bla regulator protein BlaR1